MARPAARYVCQSCGAVTSKWAGRCESCTEWNTIIEEVVQATPTLAKILPPPVRRIIGDLSDRERVLIGLDLLYEELTEEGSDEQGPEENPA